MKSKNQKQGKKSTGNKPKTKKGRIQIRSNIRKKAVLEKIIENGGNYHIQHITDEIAAQYPKCLPPSRHTIASDIYEIFDNVPPEILRRQKAETAKELLYTDSIMKAMMNKMHAYVGRLFDEKGQPVEMVVDTDEVIKIMDAFRRYKEGKINIAEAYGLKKKVADEIEHTIKGGGVLKDIQDYYKAAEEERKKKDA